MLNKAKITQHTIYTLIKENDSLIWNKHISMDILRSFGYEWMADHEYDWSWEGKINKFIQYLENVSKLVPFYLCFSELKKRG